jgi:signal transduction histidine kinase
MLVVDPEVLHKAQRIRYEAFSVFATELNKCTGYDAVSGLLTSQIKFIFDCFIFRVCHRHQQSQLVFQGFMGNSIFHQNGDEIIYPFEHDILDDALPVYLTHTDAAFQGKVAQTIFAHQKVVCCMALPITYSDEHSILITIASKEPKHFIELDFKFLKLVGDVLSNKLLQLLLADDVARKTRELDIKNKQIQSMNKYLENMVLERTEELVQANRELTTMFYRASHDFRAPLANIMGLANVAGMMTDNKEVLELFDRCRKVVVGMDSMLSKLNYLSSPPVNEPDIQINFEALFADIETRFASRLQSTGGSLTVNVTEVPPYRCKLSIMQVIFEHLIDNAITFCRKKPDVKVEVNYHEPNYTVKVGDKGQGIPAAVQPHIYDMYYRGSIYSTGNGLGLYIVRKLLKSINGEISLESKEGEYSNFIVKLR